MRDYKAMRYLLRAKRALYIGGLALLLLVVLFSSSFQFEKRIIYNPSASVQKGFYVFKGHNYERGKIILFSTPAIVQEYVAANYSGKAMEHFLKPVLAESGDHVCFKDNAFFLNHVRLAGVQEQDTAGKALPVWKECRTLKQDEYFVFSDRVSNSFDSRYYGPILKKDIVGVFKKLF